jgi:urease accessory protein
MPLDASGASYALGFLAATAILHLIGIAAGMWLSRGLAIRGTASSLAGGAIALAGLFLSV